MNQQNDIRAAALEEAAKVCEQRMEDETRWAVVALRNAAAAIRALIDTPADTQAAPAETKACPVCHGAGTWIGCHDGYDDDSCDACGGSGRASQQAAPADEREAFRKACSDFGLTPDRVDALTQQWQARAMLAAPAQPQIPEGWKMVPIVPTPEMLRAAMDCQDAEPGDSDETCFFHAFQAALAAAPAAPAAPTDKLRSIGTQMANAMYNLAQRGGETITSDYVATFDSLRKQWDAAISAAPAAPKPQEPESIEDAMQYKCDDPECIVCATPKESSHD